MRIHKIFLSSLIVLASMQISANISPAIDLDRLLAKHDRTDQDYSDKHFKALSYVAPSPDKDANSNQSDPSTFDYSDANRPNPQTNQQQMYQNYANQNYYNSNARDINANKQMENADWNAQMRAREAGNYPLNSQNQQMYHYQTYPQNYQRY